MSIAIFIFYKPSISTGPIMPCSKIAILGPPLDVGLPLRAACIRCCNTASTTKLQDKDLAEKGSHLYGKSAACSVAYSGAGSALEESCCRLPTAGLRTHRHA